MIDSCEAFFDDADLRLVLRNNLEDSFVNLSESFTMILSSFLARMTPASRIL